MYNAAENEEGYEVKFRKMAHLKMHCYEDEIQSFSEEAYKQDDNLTISHSKTSSSSKSPDNGEYIAVWQMAIAFDSIWESIASDIFSNSAASHFPRLSKSQQKCHECFYIIPPS